MLCRINGVQVAVRYLNSSLVECWLSPDPFVTSYFVALSLNFGHQWVEVPEPVRSVNVPEVRSIEPNFLSTSSPSTITLNLTRAGFNDSAVDDFEFAI